MKSLASRKLRIGVTAFVCSLLVVLLIVLRGDGKEISPEKDSVFTSTRYITGMTVGPDDTLWVSTLGGVLHLTKDGVWRKLTRADGLPSHEVRNIRVEDGVVTADCPSHVIKLVGDRWQEVSVTRKLDVGAISSSSTWNGKECEAGLTGIRVSDMTGTKSISLPPSTGSYVSAMLGRGDTLWAAMFGDGLWAWDGKAWSRVENGLPREAGKITALCAQGNSLWLGTTDQGLWKYDGKSWKQHLMPDEPWSHNCQAMVMYRGGLYISTLDEGLVTLSSGGWRLISGAVSSPSKPVSSEAPRQMVEFKGALYVRNGNGKIDRFDGDRWSGDVFRKLPRKQASSVASDGGRLYVGQWGGWSEFDGRGWVHHLKLPELQGVQITCILPDGDRLWLGTQGRGLAEVERSTDRLTWHDERSGLPDDWIRLLRRYNGRLCVGTFYGGLAWLDGGTWRVVPELSDGEITALAPLDEGVLVGTRRGIWRLTQDGKVSRFEVSPGFDDPEVQAVLPVDGGLWIGTRTGVYFLREQE